MTLLVEWVVWHYYPVRLRDIISWVSCVILLACRVAWHYYPGVFLQTTKPHLGVSSSVLPVSQCPKRIFSICWVQVRASRDGILSTVGRGAVTTRQRVMLIIIVPSKSQILGVSLREVSVLEAIATFTPNVFMKKMSLRLLAHLITAQINCMGKLNN